MRKFYNFSIKSTPLNDLIFHHYLCETIKNQTKQLFPKIILLDHLSYQTADEEFLVKQVGTRLQFLNIIFYFILMQTIKIHTLNKITHPMRRGNKKGAKVEKIRLRAKEDKIEKETTPTTASRNSGNFTKKKKYPKILTKKCNHCHNNKRNSLPEPEPKLALHTETEDGVRFLSESMVSFR